MCAGGGAAWRGRADWEGAGLGEPGGVEAVLAGEDGAWPAASARPAQSRGGREGRERERVETKI